MFLPSQLNPWKSGWMKKIYKRKKNQVLSIGLGMVAMKVDFAVAPEDPQHKSPILNTKVSRRLMKRKVPNTNLRPMNRRKIAKIKRMKHTSKVQVVYIE